MHLDLLLFIKKNLKASRPSEHPPVKRKNAKTFRWDGSLLLLILAYTERTTLHGGGRCRLWSAEQGKEDKKN